MVSRADHRDPGGLAAGLEAGGFLGAPEQTKDAAESTPDLRIPWGQTKGKLVFADCLRHPAGLRQGVREIVVGVDVAGLEMAHNPNVRGYSRMPVSFTPRAAA